MRTLLLGTLALGLAACQTEGPRPADTATRPTGGPESDGTVITSAVQNAEARINPLATAADARGTGSGPSGTLQFEPGEGGGLTVRYDLRDLPAGATDLTLGGASCEAPRPGERPADSPAAPVASGVGTGGEAVGAASPSSPGTEALTTAGGPLGQITPDAQGVARGTLQTSEYALGGAGSIVGRAVLVGGGCGIVSRVQGSDTPVGSPTGPGSGPGAGQGAGGAFPGG